MVNPIRRVPFKAAVEEIFVTTMVTLPAPGVILVTSGVPVVEVPNVA